MMQAEGGALGFDAPEAGQKIERVFHSLVLVLYCRDRVLQVKVPCAFYVALFLEAARSCGDDRQHPPGTTRV